MITFKLDKQFSRILLSSGVFNVLLAVPLILLSGAQGAGAAVLITETVVSCSMIYVLHAKGLRVFRTNEVSA